MKHLSEEELIAHAYAENDGDAAAKHLAACVPCATAYAALRSDLAEMKFREAPARDALYGDRVWKSISGFVPAYEGPKKPWLRSLIYAAAAAALVACAFIGGRLWEHRKVQTVAQNHPRQNQTVVPPPERVVVVVLSDHLDRSERLLVELKHAEADSGKMVSPLREEARSLLPANRICRQNAKHADDPALATALDRLDHLLVELADQPGGLNSATLARLQDEMNADGLLFKVRVLRFRQAASSAHTKGGTI